ncbi:unnamed protein product [Periconia digitata]|uniref:Uncharacterized protein n=1 Tax=Periconia digitata TaxID=1303443 RepID=A0A9W4UCJ0_9PLEO|nr:unnamed protein product [Periconia digitata]
MPAATLCSTINQFVRSFNQSIHQSIPHRFLRAAQAPKSAVRCCTACKYLVTQPFRWRYNTIRYHQQCAALPACLPACLIEGKAKAELTEYRLGQEFVGQPHPRQSCDGSATWIVTLALNAHKP